MGTLVISGVGSELNADRFIVGGRGVGTLNIEGGGVVNNAHANVGGGGFSTVNLSGTGSRWNHSATLALGEPIPPTVFDPNPPASQGGAINIGNGTVLSVAGITTFWTAGSIINVNTGRFVTGSLASSSAGGGTIQLMDSVSGPALTLNGETGSHVYSGAITAGSGSVGSLVKTGWSTQTLAGLNTYTGPTSVSAGVLVMHSGASSSYTASGGGTIRLLFPALGFSSYTAGADGTIAYLYPDVNGGFLRGKGSHDIRSVASFNGTTIGSDVTLEQGGQLVLNNVTLAGSLISDDRLTLNGGRISSAGRLVINDRAQSQAYESDGLLTIGQEGELTNIETSLVLGGGSRTFVGEERERGGLLRIGEGTTLELNGALLVNNGTIEGVTNINFGSLAKGAGNYGEVNVGDGGRFSPGNSPGTVRTSAAAWKEGGVYQWEIGGLDAGGWDLWDAGEVVITSAGEFAIELGALGSVAGWDPTRDYDWVIARSSNEAFTADTLARLVIDDAGFGVHNDLGGGGFFLSSVGGRELHLGFSGVPEPGAMWVWVVAVGGLVWRRRR
jgi:autotransporter-associated beta strand protein/T5SS/PEP-CTERM-associated repeat protein